MFGSGCVAFLMMPKNKVALMYPRQLQDISQIGTFGWGAAILAHTHSALKKTKKKNFKNFSANDLLRHIFALTHSKTCHLFLLVSQGFSKIFPLSSRMDKK